MVTIAKGKSFVIDCPYCKAKVAADETGRTEKSGMDQEAGEPYGHRVLLGVCPSCDSTLVGESTQVGFEEYNSYEDQWSYVTRVFPKPPKTFSSSSIPATVTTSLDEANRCLQAGANIATCAMLGRALEALCRNVLDPDQKSTKPIMLGQGLKKLKDKGIIEERLFAWGTGIQVFRNDAAHPDPASILREDAEDAQKFVYAIVEYVYDLAELYEDFKRRVAEREKLKKP